MSGPSHSFSKKQLATEEERQIENLSSFVDTTLRGKSYFTPAEVLDIVMRVNAQWVKWFAGNKRGGAASDHSDISVAEVGEVRDYVGNKVGSFTGRWKGEKGKALRQWLLNVVEEWDSGKLLKRIRAEKEKSSLPSSRFSGVPV